MYEYEETKNEMYLSIETIIDDYKQTYLNSDKLPENIFTKSLLTKNNDDENCYDVKSNFYISNLQNYIVNDEDIYISNVFNEDDFINFYDHIYSLNYKNNDENIKELYDFMISQSLSNENDNIIKYKKKFIDFMEFTALCGKTNNVEKIKDQCGKDISRGVIFLNDKILTFNGNDDNDKKCDYFNLEIMKEMKIKNFQNINEIYDFLIYIDIITNQTMMNMFTFNVMELMINNLKEFIGSFYHYGKSELSVNSFILIENNKLQVHRIKHCYIYDSIKIMDNGYNDTTDAFENDFEPDGIFTVYIIFDLLTGECYIKDYLVKINSKTNILENSNENINNENINNENISNEIMNYENNSLKKIILKNKKSTAAIGTLLTLGVLSAIPIALLLGGKKTRRKLRKGGKQRKIKTYKRKQRKTRNKNNKNNKKNKKRMTIRK
jgi:hypothetical protein